MSFGFDEFLDILDEGDLEETPVDIDEFIAGEQYMNRQDFKLSPLQRECVLAMTQIYRRDTLESFMHPEAAKERWAQTNNEIYLVLGKGSGKDFLSAIACCYVVYLLLCLRDPAKYYGKPSGDSIDIINIAVNAQQAHNVFFANVSRLIQSAPWFSGRYATRGGAEPAQKDRYNFNKNVNLYSGHSEREAWEGYNVIMVILDEISGFAGENPNNSSANSAEATYKMHKQSVTSRFDDFGKVALLSFPRSKDDFILNMYEDSIAEKNVVHREHTLKLDPELPDGIEGNEMVIEWDEDHIIRYKARGIYALKRPSWEVNPTKRIEGYTMSFYRDRIDSLMRFACMPPHSVDGLFKDHERIDEAFRARNGVQDDGVFYEWFRPDPNKEYEYYIHVDLAKKVDRCAVSMAHVEKWVQVDFPGGLTEARPYVRVDAIRWWQPTADKNVDFREVRDYIVSLAKRGFNIRKVTFDRWQSDDMINYLNGIGIKAEVLSVAKKHYIDFAVVLNDERLVGPDIEELREELKYLKVTDRDKVDHERGRYKDLSDATCGAIFNAVSGSVPDFNQEIEVLTPKSFRRQNREEKSVPEFTPRKAEAPMPRELEEFLMRARKI